jgi:hypothetical protein
MYDEPYWAVFHGAYQSVHHAMDKTTSREVGIEVWRSVWHSVGEASRAACFALLESNNRPHPHSEAFFKELISENTKYL